MDSNFFPRWWREPGHRRNVGILIIVFIILHAAILAYGVIHPETILVGDRADSRFAEIEFVFEAKPMDEDEFPAMAEAFSSSETDSFFDRMLRAGHPGDYFVQGAILTYSNQYVLIFLQLALSLTAVLCVYWLGYSATDSGTLALVASLVYIALPGTLLHPHHLVSEAIFNPLIVLGITLLVSAFESRSLNVKYSLGLLVIGGAIFVRPQLLLFPLLLAVAIWIFYRRSDRIIAVSWLPIAYAFVCSWMLVVAIAGGHHTISGRDRGLDTTFYKVAKQVTNSSSTDVDDGMSEKNRMSATEFIQIVADNPTAYARQRLTALVNFFANPGTYSIATHHFELFRGSGDTTYWGDVRARAGIAGAVNEVLTRGPGFVILIVGSAMVWAVIVLIAFVGLFRQIPSKRFSAVSTTVLIGFALYQTGIVAILSVGGRWQQRTSFDFVIVVLFVVGLKWLIEMRSIRLRPAKLR